MTALRSVAIVAHVDHGKTSLLDHLLRQSGTLKERGPQTVCVMDSNPQERERGITILAKCTAIKWQDQIIQVVDTPGHQDFGGEVERILRMVDSVLLVVCAVEGPMPQTRYVLRKALEQGFRPVVVINKMDRPEARPDWVHNEVFDLFSALGATDQQLDFPVVYASARAGWASHTESPGTDMNPLFEAIVKHVPEGQGDVNAPLQLQVATLDYSDYLGRIAIGRVMQGRIRRGLRAVCCRRDGSMDSFKVTRLMGFLGLERVERDEAVAGEVVALAGVDRVTVGETICEEERPAPLPPPPVDEPTIAMQFGINTSPFAGQEGQYVTSRHVLERLRKELEHNVGLQMQETEGRDYWRILGRGTLHLSVLIENMRREGYELSVGQPQVVLRDGQEPWEEVTINVPQESSGVVIEKLAKRAGVLLSHEVDGNGISTLRLEIPSRGLIGYRSEFLTDTRGEGILYHAFARYAPIAGAIRRRENGAMIVQENTDTVTYGLHGLQERGRLLVGPGERVYAGQVIGLHSRANDLVVNPGKSKKLTNIRSAGADEKLFLTPPLRLSLEESIEVIADDELVEITPKSIRIRKRILDHNLRKREEKARGIDN
ncbi:MAG: translational GTPase TypA [Deltaproteobacteria bacterium]|nr:translational GTPase TypA [Deltaproteobacteria bacterium]